MSAPSGYVQTCLPAKVVDLSEVQRVATNQNLKYKNPVLQEVELLEFESPCVKAQTPRNASEPCVDISMGHQPNQFLLSDIGLAARTNLDASR